MVSASDRTPEQFRDEVFGICLEHPEGSAPELNILRLGGRPEVFAEVVGALARHLPDGVDVVVGLGLTGGILATALSGQTGLPFAFARAEAVRYPHLEAVVGADVAGKRVAVVEGVVASGVEAMKAALDAREAGATVHEVICLAAHPDPETSKRMAGDSLSFSPLFTWPDDS